MRVGSLGSRAVMIRDDRALDVFEASGGEFGPAMHDVYTRWRPFTEWASTATLETGCVFDPSDLESPTPAPRQVIAAGLNYRAHAAETGSAVPTGLPPIFAKFVSSVTGPYSTVTLPEGDVDWEVELAVIIGIHAKNVTESAAWDHVAGLTIAQDLSERVLQMRGPSPQFGLAKSHPGFTPLGPVLVTPDEVPDRDNIALRATLNGETVQESTTGELVVGVASLIAQLSAIIDLYPGDVILTGTPDGVGMGRSPQRYLAPGDVLVSEIDHIGAMSQRFAA